MLHKVKGNLLDAQTEALVNTVNTVGVMGKGIALQFKKAFPANFKAYKKVCDADGLDVGQVHLFDRGGLQNPRYIINFPTKKHWRSKSKIEYIEQGLTALIAEIQARGIRSIALPPLGCGHGGLSWNDVYILIEQAFAGIPDVDVTVFAPTGAPAAESMKDVTKRPSMTIGRAVVLELMRRYLVPGFDYRLALLEIQKLVYFQVEAGEQLKHVKFDKGPYGPYADVLRHVLEKLDGHFIAGYGDGQNKPDTPIRLRTRAAEEAQQLLKDNQYSDTRERFERVINLIEGFETPYGMELLASVHWVATKERDRYEGSAEGAVEGIKFWGDKSNRLQSDHIKLAWDTLKDRGWIGDTS